MKVTDSLYYIAQNLWSYKLRSSLAIAGIVWGVLTVLILAAIGQGMYQANQKQLSLLSQPTIIVSARRTSLPYQGFPSGRQLQFSVARVLALPRALAAVKAVTPMPGSVLQFKANGQSQKVPVNGVGVAFLHMFPKAYIGRVFRKVDMTYAHRVVFLGAKAKVQFFGNKPALGKTVLLAGVPFTVIGYNVTLRGNANVSIGGAYIPYSTYFSLWRPAERMETFAVWLHRDVNDKAFEGELRNYLAFYGQFSSRDKQALFLFGMTSVTKTIGNLFLVVRVFLIFCGLMTLMVGGIGVANMMYFIVNERRRQIGLAMALGATPCTVLSLVLVETFGLLLIGGLVSFFLTGLILKGLSQFTLPAWIGVPQLVPWIVWVVCGALFITALLAGVFPARKAALMSPVEALR